MNATKKKAVNVTIGKDVDVKTLSNDISKLISADNNQGAILIGWNSGLTEKGKWYDSTPMQLPIPFINATKSAIAIEWLNLPVNKDILGFYAEDDNGTSIRIDGKKAKEMPSNKTFELTVESLIDKTIEPKNLKAVTKVIYGVRRTFNKDVWDKKIKRWQKLARELDATGEIEPKVKANRSFVEMVAWNILGNPDEHNSLGYSGSLSRKLRNSKTSKINIDDFEKLAIAFVDAVRKLEK
jgi:hypothetical protein